MSVDITGVDGSRAFMSNYMWWTLLRALSRYGWTPTGTRPPSSIGELSTWDGNYELAEGQVVDAQDAKELANAIERLLQDENASVVLLQIAEDFARDVQRESFKLTDDLAALVLTPRVREVLQDVVAIARKGAFVLE